LLFSLRSLRLAFYILAVTQKLTVHKSLLFVWKVIGGRMCSLTLVPNAQLQ
jgi:hypothetical protein